MGGNIKTWKKMCSIDLNKTLNWFGECTLLAIAFSEKNKLLLRGRGFYQPLFLANSQSTNGWSNDVSSWESCQFNQTACPDQYASESIGLACKYAYRNATPGTTLEMNISSRLPIVEKRLAQGGIRLAAILNRIFLQIQSWPEHEAKKSFMEKHTYASESIGLACKYAYRNATPGTTLEMNIFSRLPIVEEACTRWDSLPQYLTVSFCKYKAGRSMKLRKVEQDAQTQTRYNVEKYNSSVNTLPQDVVELILERLPIKSLLRFRSVSKTWKLTIQTRRFQERQLIHHSQSSGPDILSCT
ncbi:hypothetical protein Bca52824_092522 [Brassica carinata]|uniref:Aspergillus nuclease S1 n=1 Tax=Brassica carinata TaxID=52824 RepID=A0A8X7NS46_BRACI|nr:hypothetical protein Bca52824_092522 [Brassica carinata]